MTEIPKAYEPQSVEDKWYDFWVKQNCFTADPARVSDKRPAYSIVIPPPNVTGMLHMGHVLNNTIQDILSRKARMDGKEVLWLPGTDHAGIATEGMVTKQIRKEEKKSKQEIGREEFIKRVWTWKEKHGGIIIEQLKKLGCSCDWTRERFTMDPDYVQNVQRVFVDLYKKGLIYRGKRMVNWCPATQTALSDEEVEMKPQKGFMYHFKVQVAESIPGSSGRESAQTSCPDNQSRLTSAATEEKKGGPVTDSEGRIWLTIATTRPETIPGDTAVAVNPKDARYAHLIGKHIIRPLPIHLPQEQKLIPIIGDEHVDFEFGTGVLKVTPAHDKADFEIGQRHKLPIVDIMNANGTMNELAGESLTGLDRFEARAVAVERLKEIGALVEEKPYENNVGFSQRADVPIEPRLSEQWFLKYPSVEVSKACVEQDGGTVPGGTGDSPVAVGNLPTASEAPGRLPGATGQWPVPPGQKMRFHPDRWAKVYDHWLTNIQDWCISRQLWWGHRIPVWYRKIRLDSPDGVKLAKQHGIPSEGVGDTYYFIDHNDFYVGIEAPSDLENWEQDPDVLDTWFSSWLWPFATMGWPEQTETLKKFYPTTDLVTGPDIIFFWVARMIMAGYEYMGELPFKNVYFTGIIRDKQGRKMSKTLGNSPDPLELIAKYGADALRFGTMRSAPLGQDVLFDEKDVELGRNFCNKLWNACRFRQMQGGETETEINPALLTSDDKWILLRLDQAIREVSEALVTYNFATAVQALYRFFWSEYCDWYVEASKAAFGRTKPESSPSPLNGERAGVRGGDDYDAGEGTKTPPHPDPLPPVERGGEGIAPETDSAAKALRANKLAVIDFVLGNTLRLFHPFLPFITEELWHGMGFSKDLPENQGGQTIMYAPWPKPFSTEEKEYFGLDDAADQLASAKYALVSLGRNLRREFNLPANKRIGYVLKPAGQLPASEAAVLQNLLNAEPFTVDATYQPPKGTPSVQSALGELFLPLAGLIDVAAEQARLGKELDKVLGEIARVEAKLANPNFTDKAPANVLAEHRQRLADWQARRDQVQSALKSLEG